MNQSIIRERISTNYDTSFQETEYIRTLADGYFKKARAEKMLLKTPGDIQNRRKKLQAQFKKSVGILPDRHAPLNVKICNEHTLPDGIILRNITFDSLPGLAVTATLWLPENYEKYGNLPAAILAVGHSPVGRAHDTYTIMAQMLSKNGIVVLSCDPPGQFERVQYPDEGGKSRIGGAVAEHFQIGFPCHLTGLTLASFFVRDLERAVDVLESLPFVDNDRIGITGCSGGGMMTSYMSLWDDRFAAAAPSCYITTRQASLLNGRPCDPEQIVPSVIKDGIDHDDFMGLLAPKPHLICAAESDPVDIGGAEYTHLQAKKIYSILGKEENARFFTAPTGHGLFEGHREAITRFLTEVLKAPVETVDVTQPEPINPELLKCTKTGCLLTDNPNSKSLFDCYNDYLKTHRYTPCDKNELRERVLTLMKTPCDMENRLPVRFPRTIGCEPPCPGVTARLLWFFSEGESEFNGMRTAVCGILYEPENAKECVILVQNNQEDIKYCKNYLSEGKAVFMFYPRGIGANKSLDAPNITTIKSSVGKILSPEYRRNCDAAMLGTSIAALRTYDCLRAYDLMTAYYKNISFAGVSTCALYALAAASVAETTSEVFDEPISYESLATDPEYQRNDREEVFGILEYFDIPLLAEKLKI